MSEPGMREPGVREPGVLVVAKAPVPGQAKTRLAAELGDVAAAEVAAAALLDTLDAVEASGLRCAVAWTGRLADAHRAAEIRAALTRCTVLPQRGDGLSERLAGAHRDAAAALAGAPVLQIGMDTPQLSSGRLRRAAEDLGEHDAVLGPAGDGGWWALGVRTAALTTGLGRVPMSRPDTGRQTLRMLVRAGASVGLLEALDDVDTVADAHRVAAHPDCGRRFGAAVRATACTEVGWR